MFHSLGLAGWAFRGSMGQILRARIWGPFLLVALFQVLGLGLLLAFSKPGVSSLTVPLITWVGGEGATHYPMFFAALPQVFDRWNLLVGVLVASLTGGAATVYFASAYGRNVSGSAWAVARRHYGSLFVVSLIGATLSIGVYLLASLVPTDLILGNGKVRWGVRGASLLLFVLTQSAVVYATAAVVIGDHSWRGALALNLRMLGKLFLTTLFVVGFPVALNYPLSYLTERVDWFLFKFTPELMVGALLARIGLEMILAFLLIGAVTRLYLTTNRSES